MVVSGSSGGRPSLNIISVNIVPSPSRSSVVESGPDVSDVPHDDSLQQGGTSIAPRGVSWRGRSSDSLPGALQEEAITQGTAEAAELGMVESPIVFCYMKGRWDIADPIGLGGGIPVVCYVCFFVAGGWDGEEGGYS